MTKSEKILKAIKKSNPEARNIIVDSNSFWAVYDHNDKTIASGDLIKGTHGLGGMKSI